MILFPIWDVAASGNCLSSDYGGNNFFLNVLSGALSSASALTVSTNPHSGHIYASNFDIQSALFDDTFGLSKGSNHVTPNVQLSAHFDAMDTCIDCVRQLYLDIVARVTVSDTFWLSGCPVVHSAGPHTVSEIALSDSDSLLDLYECIRPLQGAIDVFNACTGNEHNVVTGESLSVCSTDDFLEIDAVHSPYVHVMNIALFDVALPVSFSRALSQIPCGTCFNGFVSTVQTKKAELGVDGVCGSVPNSSDMYVEATCFAAENSIVKRALFEMYACAGFNNTLSHTAIGEMTGAAQHIATQSRVLYNEALRIYPIVSSCVWSISTDPLTDPTAAQTWRNCIQTKPLQYFPLFASIPDATLDCYMYIARAALGVSDQCADPYNEEAGGCLSVMRQRTDLLTGIVDVLGSYANSPVDEFYRCAGFAIALQPSQCSEQQLESVPAVHRTYWGVMDAVLASESPAEAAKDILNLSDLKNAIGDLPCFACYAALGAELQAGRTDEMKKFCDRSTDSFDAGKCVYSGSGWFALPYGLYRFLVCSGGPILSGSVTVLPTECAPADIMQLEGVFSPYKTMMSAVLFGGSDTAFQDAYSRLPCRSCFDSFVASIRSGTIRSVCCGTDEDQMYSLECLETQVDALAAFRACSKNRLNTVKPHHPATDHSVLYNQGLRIYQPLVQCGRTVCVKRRLRHFLQTVGGLHGRIFPHPQCGHGSLPNAQSGDRLFGRICRECGRTGPILRRKKNVRF